MANFLQMTQKNWQLTFYFGKDCSMLKFQRLKSSDLTGLVKGALRNGCDEQNYWNSPCHYRSLKLMNS